jgi:hypothetical protein
MKIATIDPDLAKNVIQIHGIDLHGNTMLRKQLKRSQVIDLFVKFEPCLIDKEACGSARHRARKLVFMLLNHRLPDTSFRQSQSYRPEAASCIRSDGFPDSQRLPIPSPKATAAYADQEVQQSLFSRMEEALGASTRPA